MERSAWCQSSTDVTSSSSNEVAKPCTGRSPWFRADRHQLLGEGVGATGIERLDGIGPGTGIREPSKVGA